MEMTTTGAIAMKTSAARSRRSKRKSFAKTQNSAAIARASVPQSAAGQRQEDVLQARLFDVEFQDFLSVGSGALQHARRELELVDAHTHHASAIRHTIAAR